MDQRRVVRASRAASSTNSTASSTFARVSTMESVICGFPAPAPPPPRQYGKGSRRCQNPSRFSFSQVSLRAALSESVYRDRLPANSSQSSRVMPMPLVENEGQVRIGGLQVAIAIQEIGVHQAVAGAAPNGELSHVTQPRHLLQVLDGDGVRSLSIDG